MNRGIGYAAGAYVLWGLLTIYWKSLHGVPALEIMVHRIVWSLGFVLLLLAVRRRWTWLRPALRNRRIMLTYTTSAVLLAGNWYTYIWAVNNNHIVEASLGYFITPLVSVVLGVLFLKERMRRNQGLAIGLAAAGVLFLTFVYGALPWIGLVIAATFSVYGLIRKTAALESVEGLTLETMVLFPLALGYMLWQQAQGTAVFGHSTITTTMLLVGAGAVTAPPLLLFAAGARRIRLTTLGLLQYITPTIQFLLGIVLYHEALSTERLIGFAIIWLALILYSAEGLLYGQRATTTLAPSATK